MNWSGPISLFTTSNALSNDMYQSRDATTGQVTESPVLWHSWSGELPCPHQHLQESWWCFPPSLQAHHSPAYTPKNPAATPRDRNHTNLPQELPGLFSYIRSATRKHLWWWEAASHENEKKKACRALYMELYLSAIHGSSITTPKHGVVKQMQQFRIGRSAPHEWQEHSAAEQRCQRDILSPKTKESVKFTYFSPTQVN